MKTQNTIFLFFALVLCGIAAETATAQAKSQTAPDVVVANLYKQHKQRSPFFQTKSRALLDKYFDKKLANLILQDAIRSKGEVGNLDGDPLFNAQDMEIKNFAIHKPVYRAGAAEVLVSFENFGQKKEITFFLARRPQWKITNLKYDDGADLVGILQGK